MKLSQEDFAKELHISLAAYKNYEKGERAVPRNIQLRIFLISGENPCRSLGTLKSTKLITLGIDDFNIYQRLMLRARKFRSKRALIVSQYQSFCRNKLSVWGRRLNAISNNSFASSAICYNVGIVLLNNNSTFSGETNFAVSLTLISFFGLTITVPCVLTNNIRYYLWRRRTYNNRQS